MHPWSKTSLHVMAIKKPISYLYNCYECTSSLCGSKEATSSCIEERSSSRMQSAGMVFWRTNATIGIFLTFYSKRASHQRCKRISGLQSSPKLYNESLETKTPAIGISINTLYSSDSWVFFKNTEDSSEMAHNAAFYQYLHWLIFREINAIFCHGKL